MERNREIGGHGGGRFANPLFYGCLALLALALRIPQISPLAVIGPDASEYIYCIERRALPHSPYLFFLWIGYLIQPFIRLDWGLVGVSMAASLGSVVLFGLALERWSGSRFAGWVGAASLSLFPVSIRFAGVQEVYMPQMFWLTLAWWCACGAGSPLACGLAFGIAVGTHTGSLFALPATLFLLARSRSRRGEDLSHFLPATERPELSKLRPVSLLDRLEEWLEDFTRALPARKPKSLKERLNSLEQLLKPDLGVPHAWFPFSLGVLIPLGVALAWIGAIWLVVYGVSGLPLLPLFLRGAAPPPQWGSLLGAGAGSHWWEQIGRTWGEFVDPEVFGFWPFVLGGGLLLLAPFAKAAPWWLLMGPFLLYEGAVGLTLDRGIYAVFVAPALAVGIGLSARWVGSDRKGVVLPTKGPDPGLFGYPLGILCLAVLIAQIQLLPFFAETARVRKLFPWHREDGEQMALAKWVRANSPPETLVVQPSAWAYCGLASALYTQRIPIWIAPVAGILIPGPWKPLFVDDAFQHAREVTETDLEGWIDQDQPLVAFDADPFRSWLALWPKVNIERFETRPILWLDQNQTGTSRYWEGCTPLASVDIGNPTEEARFQVEHVHNPQWASLDLPLFRPTLYRIARKTDPPLDPPWVEDLRRQVPIGQRGAPPRLAENGVTIPKDSGGLTLRLPTQVGKEHVLRLVMQSEGYDYIVECLVFSGGRWVSVGMDMERITVEPRMRFTELYFRVPGRWIPPEFLRIRLEPGMDLPYFNAFRADWGVRPQ